MELGQKIKLDTIVVQTKGLVAADLDEEKVMLDIEKGRYYGLNLIGSHIWELIEKPKSVQQVMLALLKEYDVEEKDCQHDLLEFLNNLYAKGLVEIA